MTTNRRYPTNPLPGVLAMVLKGDKVLLVQRAHEPDIGKWGFPGGLMEVGETVAEATIRELTEETGVIAEAGPVVDVFDIIHRDREGLVRFHFLLMATLCTWVSGEGVASTDAAAVGWFTKEEIAGMDTSKNLPRLVKALFERLECAQPAE